MILASAGAGKTHALTDRYVQLLAHGARPERIVALTFTRKAAGEFFDKIVEKLARAARDERAAAQLARDIGAPALRAADFLALLRGVIDAMPRLRLGTLDGFFARVVQAFPLELGLAGDFEVMEEHAARAERRRVLRRMFAGSARGLAPAQAEFAEAFKLATFGHEEKRLGARLDAFLDEHHQIWLAAPEAARWGEAARIWPGGCAWLEPGDAVAAARALRAWLEGAGVADRQRARWENFIAAAAAWQPGASAPQELTLVLEKALAAWGEIGAGRAATLELDRKKQDLTPAAAAALAVLVRRVMGGEIGRRLAMTRGIAAVLGGYEAVYHEAVRRAGKLGFDDVRRLLEPDDEGGPRLASGTETPGRLAIDYRLDAGIDHWLLDEFQDTSFAQWSVLRGLIDEAIQDPEGRRSFFYVGDVKQAIYGWRGGDARLFLEIFERYNAVEPGTIAERHLVDSWRSGPAVIEMVNAVFGDAAAITGVVPAEAAARWSGEWRAHASAVPGHTGQAALLHGEDELARRELARAIIREIDPLARGLSCAVLVRDNAGAAEIAEFLRAGGVPAIAESDLRVGADNPAGAALLALLQAAAHPGDTLAWEHARMSPLGAALAAEGITAPEALTRRVLGQIHAQGFGRTAEFWAKKIEARLSGGDAFTRGRLRQFVAAAGAFDATGSREAGEFMAFMRDYALRDPEGAGVVRVMTIHKAKGLGFDVVVLPELEGRKLAQRRDGLAVQRAPDRSVEWVLDLPNKIFCEADPVLVAHLQAAEAEAGHEQLALLYVAMTRAKRAMFVLTKPPGQSASRNYPRLLAAALGADRAEIRVGAQRCAGAWSSGDPDWHRGIAPPAAPARRADGIPTVAARPAPRRPALRPSGEAGGAREAARLFALEGGGAAEFGRAVHGLLAAVEWGGPEAERRLAAAWRAHGAAGEIAAACLRAPALAAVWARPAEGAEVWRERAFEVVLDGAWVTGVFDRVVVERDGGGRVRRATVYDFKTDRLPPGAIAAEHARRHAGQLAAYRRAAAVLAGAPCAAVAAAVVFTGAQQIAPVTPP
jgi:ATP-dependent exoDNAse (exonuclease V) beta subunit